MNDPTILKRLIRRDELLKLIPMSDATIYQLEKAGKFPKRFHLTPRCAVWDLECSSAQIQAGSLTVDLK